MIPAVETIVNNTILLFTYKGKKPVKQTYKVNLMEPIKIGGFNEDGYYLSFFPEGKASNTCITTIDLLKAIRYGQVDTEVATITAIITK
jgi:hypothetical protein